MSYWGTFTSFATELTSAVTDAVNVPVIASGGVGSKQHFVDGYTQAHASALLAASVFHFGTFTIPEVKRHMAEHGVPVREI